MEFFWKNQKIRTMRETMDAVLACKSPKEAREFMKVYGANCKFAKENIGYMTGYYDSTTAKRIMEWCDVEHPIFGKEKIAQKKTFEIGKKITNRKKR